MSKTLLSCWNCKISKSEHLSKKINKISEKTTFLRLWREDLTVLGLKFDALKAKCPRKVKGIAILRVKKLRTVRVKKSCS